MDNEKIILPPGSLNKDPDVTKTIQENLNPGVQESQVLADEQVFDRNFKPKGAIAFFALLVLLGMVIWFGIYFLMLSRV